MCTATLQSFVFLNHLSQLHFLLHISVYESSNPFWSTTSFLFVSNHSYSRISSMSQIWLKKQQLNILVLININLYFSLSLNKYTTIDLNNKRSSKAFCQKFRLKLIHKMSQDWEYFLLTTSVKMKQVFLLFREKLHA